MILFIRNQHHKQIDEKIVTICNDTGRLMQLTKPRSSINVIWVNIYVREKTDYKNADKMLKISNMMLNNYSSGTIFTELHKHREL